MVKHANRTILATTQVADQTGNTHGICPDCGTMTSREIHSKGCPPTAEDAYRAAAVAAARARRQRTRVR